MAARPGFEPGAPASGAGVVPVPPSRTGLVMLRVVWTERFELPTSGLRRRRASSCTTSRWVLRSTDGGSRTRTDGGLSAAPLPVGLRQQVCRMRTCRMKTRRVDRAGVEPATFSSRGSCASVAPPAQGMVAGAGIEPARKAYETSLIPDPPQCDGVTGRTRTGFLRGHIPACRCPLQPPSRRGRSRTSGILRVREAVCR